MLSRLPSGVIPILEEKLGNLKSSDSIGFRGDDLISTIFRLKNSDVIFTSTESLKFS